MKKIEDVVEVYANGRTIPLLLPERRMALNPLDWISRERERIGAVLPIVAIRWTHEGHAYEDVNCPVPIPDMSGLVYATAGWKQWVVINPDSSTRFIIDVPHVREHSNPSKGDLGNPRHLRGDPPHVMYGEGSDGYQDDCRFFFDMHTGQLLRTDFVGRHW
jgi:hypothetical protein